MDHLSKDPQELARNINQHFAGVFNQMPVLNLKELPAYKPTLLASIITPDQVYKSVRNIKTSKATHPSDIPSKIVKEFACVSHF